MFLLTTFSYGERQKKLCFTTDTNSSLCAMEENNTIILDSSLDLGERIYEIQNTIRSELKEKQVELILLAEGFDATVLTIAQGNMLKYYRKHIKGLVLKNPEANYVLGCKRLDTMETNSTCKLIDEFNVKLNVKASRTELLKAISPAYQVDLYTPKCVIMDSNKRRIGEWEKLLKENSINYSLVKEEEVTLNQWFPFKQSKKIQPKDFKVEPKYFGPLLRYHLWKISYKSKHEILEKLEVAYGLDKLQKYDVFYKKNSKKNPLLIYVHGGGWTQGDKVNFNDFCEEYADKGFTTVSINYRLMDLPSVGMKEMISDVKSAIEHILGNASEYFIDLNRTVIMAESAGAQLAYMATTKLSKKNHIKVAVYNSITSNLRLNSVKKQIRLSGFKEKKVRKKWLDGFSPLKNLQFYKTMTLGLHSIDDRVVPMKHLADLEIYSVINFNNIESLWIKNASHPISPKNNAVQPSYMELDLEVYDFILKHIK